MMWITTYTGHRIDLNDPQPDQISIEDIAHGLSNLCRFTGQTRRFYSVAQHSVLVARYAPRRLRLRALLHDAHEAYMGDWSKPFKLAMPPSWRRQLRIVERRLTLCIAAALDVELDHHDAIKHADNMAARAEGEFLFRTRIADAEELPTPPFGLRSAWRPEAAEARFLRAFERMTADTRVLIGGAA